MVSALRLLLLVFLGVPRPCLIISVETVFRAFIYCRHDLIYLETDIPQQRPIDENAKLTEKSREFDSSRPMFQLVGFGVSQVCYAANETGSLLVISDDSLPKIARKRRDQGANALGKGETRQI